MSYVIIMPALDELFYKQEWELNQGWGRLASWINPNTYFSVKSHTFGEEVHFDLKDRSKR